MLIKKLQEMTEVQDVSQHPELLEKLTREFPNTIKIIESAHDTKRYTCMVHAFDFVEKPEYLSIATSGIGRIYAGPAFGRWLIENNLLEEISAEQKPSDCMIFYFKDENLTHAGFLKNERVVSKWGIGLLYNHEIFEVPESYGSKIRLFKKLPYDQAILHFRRFAEYNGLRFKSS